MATPGAKARRNSSGLVRDIEILELLADPSTPPGGLGVVRVAERLGRDKATVSRAMATLADGGLLQRDPGSLDYHIGHRVYALAAVSAEAALARQARPFLRQLARHCRETAHLSVLRGDLVLTLLSELSPNEVRTTSWEGRTTDILRTPSGRVLISDWSEDELVDWYSERRHAAAERRAGEALVGDDALRVPAPAWLESVEPTGRVHDFASLRAELEKVRSKGFATSDEEFEVGVVAASAPVHDQSGRVVAAINVSAPKGRVGVHLDRLGLYVARAAARLSVALGHDDPRLH